MKRIATPSRLLAASLILAAGGILVAVLLYRHHYPHGLRSGKLTTFMLSLEAYATDHGGHYPDGGATALQSLQKLYPNYAEAELAGMSGNERKTAVYLRQGRDLDTNISSWVYFPGLTTNDNTTIAIIWEREPGIFINGSRAEGHAVGFVRGGYDQILPGDWPSFLERQEKLRTEAMKARAAVLPP